MSEIINILERPLVDESITKKEYHSYVPYLKSFGNNDEIRISIQNQDLYVLPSESFLYIDGTVSVGAGKPTTNVKFNLNCMAHFFDEIRYELNGIEIDRTRQVGVATTLKNFVSLNTNESDMLENAGWWFDESHLQAKDYFNYCIPLKMLLGFAEDYKKIILNSKHELILLRSKSDANVAYSSVDAENKALELKILNIVWKVPHIQVADTTKLQLFKTIKSSQPLTLSFRNWDCHFNPALTNGTSHFWSVKMAPQNERPRFIILAFFKGNEFTHCNLTDIKVHLNSESFPYDDLNLEFKHERYALLYEMYAKFQESYYMRDPQPLIGRNYFKSYPIIVIDVTHQNEQVKAGPIDVRLQFKTSENMPAGITAYCMLIYDRLIQYTPLTGEVTKVM